MGDLYSDLTYHHPKVDNDESRCVWNAWNDDRKTRWKLENIDVMETPEEEDSDDIPLVVQDWKDKTTVGNVRNALGRSQQERLEKKGGAQGSFL